MPNVNAILNEQIRRLARREITASTKTLKRVTAHYRRDIAALKRQVKQLAKLVTALQKSVPPSSPTVAAGVIEKARLRVDGLKGHRMRLGLSAKDYGKLMGGLGANNLQLGSRQVETKAEPVAQDCGSEGYRKTGSFTKAGVKPLIP